MSEKITVLVADDNNDFTTTLSNYLEKEEEIEIPNHMESYSYEDILGITFKLINNTD